MEINVEKKGKLVIIGIKGQFYLRSIDDLDKVWEEQAQDKPEVIAFNCKELNFIDSSAIGTLVKFYNISSEYNIKMIIYDLSEDLVDIFATAKLDKVIPIMSREKFDEDYLNKK